MPEALDNTECVDFVAEHLTAPPPEHVWWDDSCSKIVKKITTMGNKAEPKMYSLICTPLTTVSKKLYGMDVIRIHWSNH